MTQEHFDAVVIGSGFGGSVSAYRLAEAGKSVCVLERGKRYGPGDFARTPAEMAANYWDPSKGGHGLFNFWSFKHVEALVASGLGGGSLVYSNVLLPMEESWFRNELKDGEHWLWPVTRDELEPHYKQVRGRLGAAAFPLEGLPYDSTPPKARELKQAADALRLRVESPELAVTFTERAGPDEKPSLGVPIYGTGPGERVEGRYRYTCRLCGECPVGCNYGSKNTLDYNYLADAEKRGNVVLRDRCEVRTIARRDGPGNQPGFDITHVWHDPEREGIPFPTRQLDPRTVTADQVILAAGSLGSTYLLLANKDSLPGINTKLLGTRFSSNGDLFGVIRDSVDETGKPRIFDPTKGPTVTTAIWLRDRLDGGDGPGGCIQDIGYPNFFSWAIEGLDVPAVVGRVSKFAARRIGAQVTGNPTNYGSRLAALFGIGTNTSATLPLAGMGRDAGDGVMSLNRKGYLQIKWSPRTSKDTYRHLRTRMAEIAGELNGRFLEVPPRFLARAFTVHPLGGCPMGRNEQEGVVDSFGAVFGCPGLFVVDGSILPGAAGINPSLTIAALANRAADRFTET
jgi:cholesterol oxidase